jgi:putative peptide zinc metalloprotease protein
MTAEELIASTRDQNPQLAAAQDDGIRAFLDRLIEADAIQLAGSGRKEHVAPRRIAFQPKSRLPLRVRLFSPNRPVAPVFAAWLYCNRFVFLFAAIIFLLAALSYCIAGPRIHWNSISWPLLVAAILLHGCLHETSHTLATSGVGIKIRDAGFAILYWILPVLYVDRTDAYRLRNPRQRAWIAITGPLWDATGAGITAVAAWCTSGGVAATLHALSLCQLLFLFSNLNPFLPSDGYHAVEALVGELNFRGRAFSVLLHQLRIRTLPPYLRRLSRKQQWFCCVYSLASAAYLVLLFAAALVVGYHWTNFISRHF